MPNSLYFIVLTLISFFTVVEFTVPVPYDINHHLTSGSEKNLYNGRKIPPDDGSSEKGCEAHDGRNVSHGLIYIPGPNMCSMCVCYHGEPMWCKMIFCPGPPWKKCAKWINGPDCCEFYCLEYRPSRASGLAGHLPAVLGILALNLWALRLSVGH